MAHPRDRQTAVYVRLARLIAAVASCLRVDRLLLRILTGVRKPAENPRKVFIGHIDSAVRFAKVGCVLLGPISRLVPDLAYYGAPAGVEVDAAFEYKVRVTLKMGGIIQQVVHNHDSLEVHLP